MHTEYVTLVVYVPIEDTGSVRAAMCDAGAGTVEDGHYDRVTYIAPCTLHVRVLDPEHAETGREIERPQNRSPRGRGKAICRRERIEAVIQAILEVHPHDTPAISILPTLTGEFRYWNGGM